METKQIINWLRDKADRGPNHSWTRMLNMAADRLDELEQRLFVQRELSERQRWIPVAERLPQNDTYILVTTDGVVIPAYWHNDRMLAFTAIGVATVGGVTHWMPLPEPPKGD